MALVLSTGGLHALADASDSGHAAAHRAWAEDGGPAVVVAPVLCEGLELADQLLGPEAAAVVVSWLASGRLLFQALQAEDWTVAEELRPLGPEVGWSGLVGLAACRRLGVTSVLALEPEVRALAARLGIVALPAEVGMTRAHL